MTIKERKLDVLALLLARKVHIAELALAQRLADVEVRHFPLFLLLLLLTNFSECLGVNS